ncbi:MAG: response regulator [Bacteroidales bacterium]|nr:response regulator [Bacteroidales bacterium]MCF8456808.1 response regulator [Bacteroidales bacterium]
MYGTKHIALIDKHEIYRTGLKMVLRNLDAVLVAEGENSSELLTDPIYQKADLLFIDIGIQCSSCGNHIKEFLLANPASKVIGMVQHYDQVRLDDLKQTGISGFLLKNTQRKEIETVIREVDNGEFYIPESISEQLKTI